MRKICITVDVDGVQDAQLKFSGRFSDEAVDSIVRRVSSAAASGIAPPTFRDLTRAAAHG